MKINNIKLMNKQIKTFFVLAFTLVMSVTSCLNEVSDPNGGGNALPGNVESLDSQVAAMKISVGDLESVSGALVGVAETLDVDALKAELESCSASVQDHIASVESGAQAVASTLKALELQGEIAEAVGALKAQIEMIEANGKTRVLTERIQTLEEGVASWLGDKFENYYLVESEHVKISELGEITEAQSLSADALQSDVEAGLRVGDATEELAAMIQTVGNNSQVIAKLSNEFGALGSEIKESYSNAIKSAGSDSKNALKSVNTKAAAALKSSLPTLADLSARITALETQLAEIAGRLTKIETDVNALLSKIQSITFMSEYSEDYAIAYYNMSAAKVSAPGKTYDGKNTRTPVSTVDLNYMVRPASAAAAVTKDVVSIVGYYADQIQTNAIDPSRFVNFTVNSVVVTNAERGIVTVTMSHDLKDDFYYRQTGAKCAMYIATGMTDISSKFVELYPKDNSSTVYVEGIKLNQDDFEIDEGQTKTLTAVVNPSSATNKTIKWTSSNTEIATIDQYSGVLTAVKQGNVTITAATNGIDEWGDNLTASVNVKVNPSIRLGGPLYVEVGKTAELSLDFPPAMNVESKVWMSSDDNMATVENGIVTGVAHTYNQYTFQYNPITITCIVNGNITLTHEMSVVVPQPKQIRLNNYADDVTTVSMKVDQTISLAGSILPENVDASLFRLTYESDGGFAWIGFDSGEIKTPGSVGARYVYINVRNIDKHTYMKSSVARTVIVNVEPYYVETMKFAQETISLQPGQTSQISPILTSDVDGKQPTYREMTWTSSNPQVASVDAETGLITTHTEGNTVITATITPEAVPSGTEPLHASFTLIVETPVAPINVGDFFYSDGTWSTERDKTKTVIGIIFSNTPATADPKLMTDYEEATHGLVVGVDEYNHFIGYLSNAGWGSDSGLAMKDRCDIFNEGVSNGYTNTFHLSNYSSEKGDSGYKLDDNTPVYWAELYHPTRGVLADVTTARPQSVSTWYIPSYNEMSLMRANLDKINSSLNAAGGDTLSGVYWTSTFKQYGNNSGTLDVTAGYNMENGSWKTYVTGAYKQMNPVRVVFAF